MSAQDNSIHKKDHEDKILSTAAAAADLPETLLISTEFHTGTEKMAP